MKKKHSIKWTEETEKMVCDLYQSGKKDIEIAQFIGWGRETVRKHLRSAGIEPQYRKKTVKPKPVKEEVKMVPSGRTIDEQVATIEAAAWKILELIEEMKGNKKC